MHQKSAEPGNWCQHKIREAKSNKST